MNDTLSRLNERISILERGGTRPAGATVGCAVADIDRAFVGAAAGVHDLLGDDGAATGFAVLLLRDVMADDPRPVLWCRNRVSETVGGLLAGGPYGPGLAMFGLATERLIFVRTARDAQALWAAEEGLRSRALSAVVCEAGQVGTTASRRMQLAAKAGGIPLLLLRPTGMRRERIAAATRWRIACAPSEGVEDAPFNHPVWRIELVRARNGTRPGGLTLVWRADGPELLRQSGAASPPAATGRLSP